MTLSLIVLILGLILFFVPAGPPAPTATGYWTTGGKVNAIGWILIFWGVYLVAVALGVHVRLLR